MDSEADIQIKYSTLLKSVNTYEDTHPGDAEIAQLIESFQKVQQAIIKHHVFSPNEDFEEIQTENLQYLLLPYYVGWGFSQLQEPITRLKNLQQSDYYLHQFLKLIDHYGLLTTQQETQWKQSVEKQSSKITREDKIANYKTSKELNQLVQNLMKLDDAKKQREIIQNQITLKIYSTFDILSTNEQEVEVVQFRDNMNKDKELKQQYQQEQQAPIPKMKVWNVDKPNGVFQNPMCHDCKHMTEAEQKQHHVAKIWEPNPANLPTMTLDEFADMEIEGAQKQEAMMKKAKEQQELAEKDKDDDKDYWSDMQTLKDRSWDDWKDLNEKGAGNKMK